MAPQLKEDTLDSNNTGSSLSKAFLAKGFAPRSLGFLTFKRQFLIIASLKTAVEMI